MNITATSHELFEALREKLALEWVAGQRGADRVLEPPTLGSKEPGLVGPLDCIHPNRIQVIGHLEQRYLDSLGKNSHQDTVHQLFQATPAAIILADSVATTQELIEKAETSAIPLWASPLPANPLIDALRIYLSRLFAEKVTLHGVFMEVISVGVLLTGDCAVGKSELALELLSRGHRLIADDAPEFSRIAANTLEGECPEVLREFLEVRGLGILNVRAMFGDSVVRPRKYLGLIINLVGPDTGKRFSEAERLEGSRRQRRVLNVNVPEITLPVAPGRNLAVLIEAAVLNHILHMKGYNAAQQFCERQQRKILQDHP